MKIYAALTLLSLTLAACSQQATPAAQSTSSVIGTAAQGKTFANTQAAQEAQITAELQALGLDGGVSAQAVAPQVYLNVLPVPASSDSVRAYVKSTFPGPVACSVTWGDESASTNVASPTVGRIETKDHAYATFGTYTITVTCRSSESVVGTQSMTVQAGKKPLVVLDFETPVVPSGRSIRYNSGYQEKGYNFTINSQYGVLQLGTGSYFNFYNNVASQTLMGDDYTQSLVMTSVIPSESFNLASFNYERLHPNRAMSVILTGYKSDNTTVTVTLPDSGNQMQTFLLDSTWTNLTKVAWANDSSNGNWVIIDNVNVSK